MQYLCADNWLWNYIYAVEVLNSVENLRELNYWFFFDLCIFRNLGDERTNIKLSREERGSLWAGAQRPKEWLEESCLYPFGKRAFAYEWECLFFLSKESMGSRPSVLGHKGLSTVAVESLTFLSLIICTEVFPNIKNYVLFCSRKNKLSPLPISSQPVISSSLLYILLKSSC